MNLESDAIDSMYFDQKKSATQLYMIFGLKLYKTSANQRVVFFFKIMNKHHRHTQNKLTLIEFVNEVSRTLVWDTKGALV